MNLTTASSKSLKINMLRIVVDFGPIRLLLKIRDACAPPPVPSSKHATP